MSISSALSAGVSGLNSNAARLAGISDNIANSSTYGYRRVETEFENIVLSTSRGGGTYTAGGVVASSSRVVDQRGNLVGTNNPLDIAISGRGMLPVIGAAQLDNLGSGGASSLLMTRTGAFRPDEEGVLRTASGLVLMGWPANRDGTIPPMTRDSIHGLQPIILNPNDTYAEPTTAISLGFNLPAEATVGGGTATPFSTSVEYYDNLGASRTLTTTFTPTVGAAGAGRSNSWTMEIRDSAIADDPGTAADESLVGAYALDFADSAGGPLASVTTLSGGGYDPASGAMTINAARGPITLSIGRPGGTGLTQISSDFAPINVTKNGAAAGTLAAVEIDENGYLRATYDNGTTRTLFQVPLVDVPNPNGLIAMDGQTFKVSPDSGAFYLWNAGDGPTGTVTGYAREGSTTDVAAELTDLIQTQRAYSSNAKIIQTVDEMLQETTNIKR